MPVPIPKKLYDSKKSFLMRLSNATNKPGLTSFSAFPQQTRFNGQDAGETIILIVRRHPAVFINRYVMIFVLLFAGFVASSVLGSLGITGGQKFAFSTGAFIFFVLLALTLAVDTFIRWYYSVNIITDQRVVDVNFVNILKHDYAEAQLERIEDVKHTVSGFLGSVLDYGTVRVQTAGSSPEFAFEDVPRPRDVQDTLLDLLEMKQSGQL